MMQKRVACRAAMLCAAGWIAVPVLAQSADEAPSGRVPALMRALAGQRPVYYDIARPPTPITLDATGEQFLAPTRETWKFVCGSDTRGQTPDDLRRMAEAHAAAFADPSRVIVVDTPRGGGGFGERVTAVNIVYNLGGSVPAGAAAAFQRAEQYIESKWTDNVTITVNVSFASLGAGILGATGSVFQSIPYTFARTYMVNGRDSNDTIQTFLPTGSTLPVRFTGNAATVTNVSSILFTQGNLRAAGGNVAVGVDANMTYSTNFPFDYDPTNGVTAGQTSLVDVIVHETGHAMGFTSSVDRQDGTVMAMDMFRFARTNPATGGPWNPSTTAEFQTVARVVSFDNPTNDDANTDLISGEYRMSDGSPWQASHLFMQSTNPASALGIMQPAIADGVTFSPNYYKAADSAIFDAIGYDDIPPCVSPGFSTSPSAQHVATGAAAHFSVVATGTTPITYQWKRGAANLPTGDAHYTGVTTANLTIVNCTTADNGSYTCFITNACGTSTALPASLLVDPPPHCPADVDNGTGTGTPDGGVTIDDLLFYVAIFEVGDIRADLDNGTGTGTPDGGVTIDDLLFFITHFEAGC